MKRIELAVKKKTDYLLKAQSNYLTLRDDCLNLANELNFWLHKDVCECVVTTDSMSDNVIINCYISDYHFQLRLKPVVENSKQFIDLVVFDTEYPSNKLTMNILRGRTKWRIKYFVRGNGWFRFALNRTLSPKLIESIFLYFLKINS
ncbi:hypothetical protein [Providencia huaxiensis]|uniref:hypothetical protein n=1 Tax=Providencia huaxiensis TaxID=2027290 RepID=UPI0034E5B848